MGNELIKIKEEKGQQLVSARDLYIGLKLDKSQWSRWRKKNIESNDFFKENNDWMEVRLNVEGNETVDYAISLDFAKHIAMMSRTEKSHEYRNYFIDCEKKLTELAQPKLPTTFKEALLMLVEAEEEKEKLQIANKQQEQIISEYKPKVDYVDEILKSDSTLTVTQIAKDYGLSGKKLNEILHSEKVQYKQSGQWLLYSTYQNCGYTKSNTYIDDKGNSRLSTKWLQKGRLFIHDILKSRGIKANMEK